MEKNNVYHLEFFMGDGVLGAHPHGSQVPSHGAERQQAAQRRHGMVTITRLRLAAAGNSYRQARCRLGDSMVQAVQHVMTSSRQGRQHP